MFGITIALGHSLENKENKGGQVEIEALCL
jgi:hypothetical protein